MLQTSKEIEGTITDLQGKVWITSIYGEARLASVGDTIQFGDTIETKGSSAVLLKLDGKHVISLGHDDLLTINDSLLEVLDKLLEGGLGEDVNFELIEQAIEQGESIDELLPAAAAGGESDFGSSSSANNSLRVDAVGTRVSPESGFETNALDVPTSLINSDDLNQFNSRPTTTGISDLSIDQDENLSIDLSQFFSDNDPAQTLFFTIDTLPEGVNFDSETGLISGAATNDAAFANAGQYFISVTATDDSGALNNSVSTTFNLLVNNVNDLPIAGDPVDLGQGMEDQNLMIDVSLLLEDASDIDLTDSLSVTDLEITTGNGELVRNDDGNYAFVPSADWFGDVALSYNVNDGEGGLASNTVDFELLAVNDIPVVNEDPAISTNVQTSVNVDVLSNDTDVDGDLLILTQVSADNGNVSIEDDGSLTYLPNDGFFGEDRIEYLVSDNNGGEVSQSLDVAVIYNPGTVTLSEPGDFSTDLPSFSGTSSNIVGNISLSIGDQNFLVEVDDEGEWSFTLPEGQALSDGNYTIQVSGEDILGNISSAEADFVVDAHLPEIQIDSAENFDTSAPVFSGSVQNAEGDIQLQINNEIYSVTPDNQGQWTFTSPTPLNDGSYSLRVEVNDGQGNSAQAQQQITVDAFLPQIHIDDQDLVPSLASFSGTAEHTDGNLTLNINGQSYSVAVAENGTWVFTLPSNQELPDGDYEVEITGSDGQGNSASAGDSFTVDSDFPSVTIARSTPENVAEVTFNGSSANISGSLLLNVNGEEYSLTTNETGDWEYTLPSELVDGDYVATISGSDGQGNNTQAELGFRINAVDDIPLISGDLSASLVEDSAETLSAEGRLQASGGDPGENVFNPETLDGAYGSFSINAEGEWTYSADNSQAAIQSLGESSELTETFTVAAGDGVTTETVTITISGINDVPVVSDVSFSVIEGGAVVSGSVAVVDPDNTLTYSLTGEDVAGLTFNSDGSYAFDPSDEAYDELFEGESRTLNIEFQVDGDAAGPQTSELVITLSGTNDIPTVSNVSIDVVEGGSVVSGSVVSGSVAVDDPDNTLTYSLTGDDVAGLTFNSDGSYDFDPADEAYDELFEGESRTLNIEFQVDGDAAGPQTAELMITLTGTNDVPAVSDVIVNVTEGGEAVSGSVAVNDPDSTLSYSLTGDDVPGLTFNSDGSYDFDPRNEAYNELSEGESRTLDIEFQVDGDPDGPYTATLSLRITGTDDVPTISGDISGIVTEDASDELSATGSLVAENGDQGEDLFTEETLTGDYGTLGITEAGVWTYAAANDQDDIQALRNTDDTLTDTFTVTNADGVTTQTVTITIRGNDDIPEISGDIEGTVVEDADAELTTTGTLVAGSGDRGEDLFTAETLTGDYGTLGITEAGVWTYTAVNDQADIQALRNTDDTLTDTFTVTNADGVTTQTVTITIRGNDDVPEISGDTEGTVTEDADDELTTTGTLVAENGDRGEDLFTAETLTGDYGSLGITEAGVWAYTAANDQADIQGLRDASDTLTDTFTVTNADGITTQTVTITIRGNDDVPEISGDTEGTVVEDASAELTTTGTLVAENGDRGEDLFTAEMLTGDYGTLGITEAGVWTYTALNNQTDIQDLRNADDTLTDTFSVTNADGVTTQTVTITIRGNDDVPEISGDTEGTVTEDADDELTTTGTLVAENGDRGEDLFTEETLTGDYGTLGITEAGVWIYTAVNDQADIQALRNTDDTLTDTFTVTNADGVTTQTVTITIRGNDDVPEISGDTEGTVTEDADDELTTTGTLVAENGDRGEDLFIAETHTGDYGSLGITEAGVWTYTASNEQEEIQGLRDASDTLTDTFTVTNADGVTTQTVTITIRGNDDVPEISGDTEGTVTEDADDELTTTGTLVAENGDRGEDLFTAETLTGDYGTLGITEAGVWTYTASNEQEEIQGLRDASDTLTDTFTVTNADGVTTQTVTITIRGNDDVPEISGDTEGSVTEDADEELTTTGTLVAENGDQGEDLFTEETLTGDYGTLGITEAGVWTYTAANDQEEIQGLRDASDTLTDTFTVTNADGVTTQTVTITIRGNDDVPEISGDTEGTVTEDADDELTTTGTLVAENGDRGEDLFTAETLTGDYGSLGITAAGVWTYTAVNDQADIQALRNTDDTLTDTFTVTNADGVTTQTVTITIRGNDDVPEISGDTEGTVTEDADDELTTTGTLVAENGDRGEDLFAAETLTGDYGTLGITEAGVWTYTAANDQDDIQALRNTDDTLTDTFTVTNADGVTTQTVTITIRGNDDVPEISGDTEGTVVEDADTELTTTGTLVAENGDRGEDLFTAETLTGDYGTLGITEAGVWAYTAANDQADIQGLRDASDTLTDTFTVTNADGVTTQTVTITIRGNDDVPEISGDTEGTVTEDADDELTTTGTLVAENGDRGEDLFTAETLTGDYGTLGITEAGVWAYTAANDQEEIQGLRDASDTLTDTFTVTNADGVTTQTVTITIRGNDDVPEISGDTEGTVTEDADDELTTTGTLVAENGDRGEDLFTAETLTGDYGSLGITAAGVWTYTAVNDQADIQALRNTDDTLTDTFTVTNADGVTTQTVTITIRGNDDVPEISGDTEGTVTEDADDELTTTGTLVAENGDRGEDLFTAETLTGDYGTLGITEAGVWTYTASNEQEEIQGLRDASDTLTDTFTVTNADGITTQTVTITIRGNDDVPEISGDIEGTVTEDADDELTTTGTLVAENGDRGEDLFTAETLTGDYGSLGITEAGVWTYTAVNDQADIQALRNTDDTLTDTFTVTNADGVTTQTVTITIRGDDDVPEISGDTEGTVTEDADDELTTTGTLVAENGDRGEDLFTAETLTGDYGTLGITEAGVWTYTAANDQEDIQGLRDASDTLTDTFTVTNADGVTTQTVTITIRGNDDVPEISGDTEGSVVEDAGTELTTTGTLVAENGDRGEDLFTEETLTGDYGTLGITEAGVWTYTALNNQADIQALGNADDTLTDTFTVTNADGVTTQTVTITIRGNDDIPTISGDISGTVTEDTGDQLSTTGTLVAENGDAGEDLFSAEALTGDYGTFDITEAGVWTYTAANDQDDIQRLRDSSETLTETFTVTNADGVTTQDITITIQGSDNGIPDVFAEDGVINQVTENVDIEFEGEPFDYDRMTSGDEFDYQDASDVDPANFTFNTATNVTLSFVSEAAGFRNSLGWYRVDESGSITDVEVLWENSKALTVGETLTIEGVEEGEIGFFLIQNGYNDHADLMEEVSNGNGFFRFENSDGELASTSDNAPIMVYYPEGDEVNPSGDAEYIVVTFHSNYGNLNSDEVPHTDSGTDNGNANRLVIGFEDLAAWDPDNRNNFTDWNLRDFVFAVEAESVDVNMSQVIGDIEIIDEGTDISSANISISLGRASDYLLLNNDAELLADSYGISYQYDASTRTFSLTGDATIAQYEEILQEIQVASSELLGDAPRQFEISVTDTDGLTSEIEAVRLNADDAYSYDQNDFVAGTSGDDVLIGGEGDDIIFGGAGNDQLSGNEGQDTFVWNEDDAGTVSTDTISDFIVGADGDVLDFSELLEGESSDPVVLDDYFDISSDGVDTTINVDAQGDASGVDLSVVLEGVDLTLLGSEQAILQSLIDDGNLITD